MSRNHSAARSSIVALVSLLILAGAGLGHAHGSAVPAERSSTDARFNILVLGDSFSAGNGAGSYEGQKGCYRSSQNYGGWVATELGRAGIPTTVETEACSGAVAKNIWYGRKVKGATLRPQADAITPETDLVLLTIGGNDAQFSNIVKLCLISQTRVPNKCARQLDKTEKMLEDGTLEQRIRTVLNVIDHDLVPQAGIGLIGYPMLEGDRKYTIRSVGKPVKVGKRLRALQRKANAMQRAVVTSYRDPDRFHFFDVQPLWSNPFRGLYADGRPAPHSWLVKFASTISAATYYHPTPEGWTEEGRLIAGNAWTHSLVLRSDEVAPGDGIVYGQAPQWGDHFNVEAEYFENQDASGAVEPMWLWTGNADYYDNAEDEKYTVLMVAQQDPGSTAEVGRYGNAVVGSGSEEASGLHSDQFLGQYHTQEAGRIWCVALVAVYIDGPLSKGGLRSEFSPSKCFDTAGSATAEPPGIAWARFYDEYYPGCSEDPCPQ